MACAGSAAKQLASVVTTRKYRDREVIEGPFDVQVARCVTRPCSKLDQPRDVSLGDDTWICKQFQPDRQKTQLSLPNTPNLPAIGVFARVSLWTSQDDFDTFPPLV